MSISSAASCLQSWSQPEHHPKVVTCITDVCGSKAVRPKTPPFLVNHTIESALFSTGQKRHHFQRTCQSPFYKYNTELWSPSVHSSWVSYLGGFSSRLSAKLFITFSCFFCHKSQLKIFKQILATQIWPIPTECSLPCSSLALATSGHTKSKAWAGEEAQDDSLLLRGVVWQLEPVTKAH